MVAHQVPGNHTQELDKVLHSFANAGNAVYRAILHKVCHTIHARLTLAEQSDFIQNIEQNQGFKQVMAFGRRHIPDLEHYLKKNHISQRGNHFH